MSHDHASSQPLSPAARRTLREVARVVDLRTYAWTDLANLRGTSEDAAEELERRGYLVRYAAGWKVTPEGVEHLLTTEEPDPDEERPPSQPPDEH